MNDNDSLRLVAWEKVNREIAIADCRYAIVVAKSNLADAEKRKAYYYSDEYRDAYRKTASTYDLGFGLLSATTGAESDVRKAATELALQEYRLRGLLKAKKHGA